MPLVSGTKFLNAAHKGKYAVGGFNTNDLEWTKAILEAAEEKQAPVLIQTSMGAAKYMGGYQVCYDLVNDLVESMGITVPVAIHLDHGDYEAALKCIEIGYTSVMFDGSHLPFAENIEKAKDVVAKAHAKGISVECEVGSIGGEEDGIIGTGELADIEECKQMVATGIDFLACGIGNVHGAYPDNWNGLAFDHLKAIADAVGDIPLVLHGGSGIPMDQIQKSISMGISKVNVNTECQQAFAAATREYIEEGKDLQGKGFDPRKLLAPGTKAITELVKQRIDWFGSEGKA
ncbi:fructose-bisphosphate aldolase [Melissococcus plutonius]|uniref:Fructose-bisphosphate aldolase n=2 Tax=Melissococcus plutonius TaxID=33970 RepID=F3YAX9_MELPT|nr:class II fructose-bisphosphate aldolase [Melissococcus plutonius]BAL61993.1 fructose-bisphosphate aldolase class II [Melissococcus plutonius DAT561]AIM25093.1 fructose-bisphosphate aldolase Fba [Melissococcus plutonius S1]KMT25335.1 fructose-bisphosphate aldolase Fba [Melissococcus plutonius]KMT25604.1 fructose-bisphosphate aldolase Fba [Melissococcus plutonius]KMT26239.1 fructose-bisphosphate aldolase Fba [Melissococcus plutonius]